MITITIIRMLKTYPIPQAANRHSQELSLLLAEVVLLRGALLR